MADQSFPDAALSPSGTAPAAFIMHHTAGRGDPQSVVNFWKQQGKGYGAQYIMDRNGVIHDTAKEFGYNGTNEILNDPIHNLSNGNTVGMEIVANNDADVTPQQVQSAAQFIQARYPNTPVFGHGQVNPGHKEATEGLSAVNAVNAMRNQVGGAQPARPASTTPGTSLNTSPMDLVANVESGNQNIPQKIHDINTDKGTPAGGFFQIIDPTWRTYAAKAGVDLNQYPTAMSAPRNIQAQVASAIPVNQWGPNTVATLKKQFPGIDTSQTLGQVQSAALGGSLAPATPGTSIASLPAAANSSGALPGFGTKQASDDFLAGLKKAGITPNQGNQAQDQQPDIRPSPIMSGPGLRNASSPQSIGMQAAQLEPQLTGYSPGLYGQSLNSQPLAWTSAPIGAPSWLKAGAQGGPQGLGTSLNSLQMASGLSPQQLQMMMNPMMLDQGGGYG